MLVDSYTELGSGNDTVKLYINGELRKYKRYSVTCGVMAQPSTFQVTFGNGALAREIIKLCKPGQPFELKIGSTQVQSGILEDLSSNSSSGATEIVVAGRDWMAPLVKNTVSEDRSFEAKTYFDLTKEVLALNGLGDRKLTGDNTANRKRFTRSVAVSAKPSTDLVELLETNLITRPGAKVALSRIIAKVGQTWLDFLKSQYKQVGLYLWATPDGNFVLARPTAKQRPLYALFHGRGLLRTHCNVTILPWKLRTSDRHAYVEVIGRAGDKSGRHQISGDWVDHEMVALGFTNKLTIHDKDCKTPKACEYLAKRTLAEQRRASCSIPVTVSGHTTPSLLDAGKLVVWAPDTCASLFSDEYGIDEDFYIEEVTFVRDPQTYTALKLMRKLDVIYLGESDEGEIDTEIDATQRGRSVDQLLIGSIR